MRWNTREHDDQGRREGVGRGGTQWICTGPFTGDRPAGVSGCGGLERIPGGEGIHGERAGVGHLQRGSSLRLGLGIGVVARARGSCAAGRPRRPSGTAIPWEPPHSAVGIRRPGLGHATTALGASTAASGPANQASSPRTGPTTRPTLKAWPKNARCVLRSVPLKKAPRFGWLWYQQTKLALVPGGIHGRRQALGPY